MYKVFKILILLVIITGLNACDSKKTAEKQTVSVDVLPFPNKVLKRGGSITISNKNWVIANVSDSISSVLAAYLVKSLEEITGEDALITDLYSTRKHEQSIKIELVESSKLKTGESYTLEITSPHIKIKARSAAGIYNGMQTLLQLLRSGEKNNNYVLPRIIVKDSPRYLVRGITIKQSQINRLDAANLLHHLGALKINSIFIIDDDEKESILEKAASENYIKLYSGKELPGDITLISYGWSGKELEEIYKTENIDAEAKGIVLDLTSTTNADLMAKLAVLAEISWTKKDNHEYSRFKRLSHKILVTD